MKSLYHTGEVYHGGKGPKNPVPSSPPPCPAPYCKKECSKLSTISKIVKDDNTITFHINDEEDWDLKNDIFTLLKNKYPNHYIRFI